MRYEFHPEAEVELIETILYYETQALGLGERFAAEVQHAIEKLLKHPKIGASDEDGFRKWVLDTAIGSPELLANRRSRPRRGCPRGSAGR